MDEIIFMFLPLYQDIADVILILCYTKYKKQEFWLHGIVYDLFLFFLVLKIGHYVMRYFEVRDGIKRD